MNSARNTYQLQDGITRQRYPDENRSDMSKAPIGGPRDVSGDTIRLYAAMIGYGYECMRTPL
jgi:hypothetical protein